MQRPNQTKWQKERGKNGVKQHREDLEQEDEEKQNENKKNKEERRRAER